MIKHLDKERILMTHTQKKAPLRSFFAKMPLQWRLTALTTLLVTVACIFMYFFIIKKYNDSTTKAKYLGFAFYYQFQEKKYRMKVPKKSLDKVMKKVRKLTSRKWSVSNSYKAKKIAEVVRGWINYFKIGSILTVTRKLDTVIRYRFRMCIWKHWKNPKTRYKNLVKLGISKKNARCAAGFHGYARVCRTKTVCYAMSNARLKKFGLLSAEEYLCKARCQVN